MSASSDYKKRYEDLCKKHKLSTTKCEKISVGDVMIEMEDGVLNFCYSGVMMDLPMHHPCVRGTKTMIMNYVIPLMEKSVWNTSDELKRDIIDHIKTVPEE